MPFTIRKAILNATDTTVMMIFMILLFKIYISFYLLLKDTTITIISNISYVILRNKAPPLLFPSVHLEKVEKL
jgi:hypothetical protein